MNKHLQRLLVLLIPAILFGCGQKGPLTLPTPQFPAPVESPPNNAKP